MIYEYPDTDLQFSCIAGKCQDTCCAGWEVDLDHETEEYYRYVEGPFGKRLRRSMKIEMESGADGEEVRTCYFPLTEQNRCPFLDEGNLCEIIRHLGPEAISVVCDEYPRYFELIGNYQQMDMSLSCMEFGRIFFSSGPMRLQRVEDGTERGWGDTDRGRLRKILDIRNESVGYLQNEQNPKPWRERMDEIERRIGVDPVTESVESLIRRMEELEVIDHRWSDTMEQVRKTAATHPDCKRDAVGKNKGCGEKKPQNQTCAEEIEAQSLSQLEFERVHEDCIPSWFTKLCVYFVFRYTLDIYTEDDAAGVFRYIDRSLHFLWLMCWSRWVESGRKLRIEDMIDLAHLYSRQVEHCEENVAALKKKDGMV